MTKPKPKNPKRIEAARKAALARWAATSPKARSAIASELGKASAAATDTVARAASGGHARAVSMTKTERSESARKAAMAKHHPDR